MDYSQFYMLLFLLNGKMFLEPNGMLAIRPSLGGAATRSRSTDTKATSEQTASERLLSQQRWTATIPHDQFAHVLLGNLLAARSSSFLLAPQEKRKAESSQTNWLSAKQVLTPLLICSNSNNVFMISLGVKSERQCTDACDWKDFPQCNKMVWDNHLMKGFFFLSHWHGVSSGHGSIKDKWNSLKVTLRHSTCTPSISQVNHIVDTRVWRSAEHSTFLRHNNVIASRWRIYLAEKCVYWVFFFFLVSGCRFDFTAQPYVCFLSVTGSVISHTKSWFAGFAIEQMTFNCTDPHEWWIVLTLSKVIQYIQPVDWSHFKHCR